MPPGDIYSTVGAPCYRILYRRDLLAISTLQYLPPVVIYSTLVAPGAICSAVDVPLGTSTSTPYRWHPSSLLKLIFKFFLSPKITKHWNSLNSWSFICCGYVLHSIFNFYEKKNFTHMPSRKNVDTYFKPRKQQQHNENCKKRTTLKLWPIARVAASS